jgi:two-component system CheB/CheR fusion protein
VFEAEHGMTVMRNCVYVIPNKKVMTIEDGRLILSEKSHLKGPNTAIDIFLNSLAEDQKDKAIAIILSGTGTDGTRGIQAVKQAGGLVLTQDPVTAKFDGMPNSAINTAAVDFILPPELMPGEIYNYVQIPETTLLDNQDIKEHLLTDIFGTVHKQTGWDFHFYKQPTLVRRIVRRMGLGGFKNLEHYVEHLHDSPEECTALSRDFLIGVTKFFRDDRPIRLSSTRYFPTL